MALLRWLGIANAEKYGLGVPGDLDPESAPMWFFCVAPRRS